MTICNRVKSTILQIQKSWGDYVRVLISFYRFSWEGTRSGFKSKIRKDTVLLLESLLMRVSSRSVFPINIISRTDSKMLVPTHFPSYNPCLLLLVARNSTSVFSEIDSGHILAPVLLTFSFENARFFCTSKIVGVVICCSLNNSNVLIGLYNIDILYLIVDIYVVDSSLVVIFFGSLLVFSDFRQGIMRLHFVEKICLSISSIWCNLPKHAATLPILNFLLLCLMKEVALTSRFPHFSCPLFPKHT